MKNLYVFFDTVSGNCSDVFQAENDLVMRRSALRSLASLPPEISYDYVVLHVATISYGENGTPEILPCSPVRNALSGASPEVAQIRSELMAEVDRLSSLRGDSDAK